MKMDVRFLIPIDQLAENADHQLGVLFPPAALAGPPQEQVVLGQLQRALDRPIQRVQDSLPLGFVQDG